VSMLRMPTSRRSPSWAGTDAHREDMLHAVRNPIAQWQLDDDFVSDAVLSSGLRDAHGMTRYLVVQLLSRYLVSQTGSVGFRRPQIDRSRRANGSGKRT
jgi:hypothetical protein